eukprot:6198390-Pleurochrysis_carterae.AAC.1
MPSPKPILRTERPHSTLLTWSTSVLCPPIGPGGLSTLHNSAACAAMMGDSQSIMIGRHSSSRILFPSKRSRCGRQTGEFYSMPCAVSAPVNRAGVPEPGSVHSRPQSGHHVPDPRSAPGRGTRFREQQAAEGRPHRAAVSHEPRLSDRARQARPTEHQPEVMLQLQRHSPLK